MQRRLMSILACPVDKFNPLRLIELESVGDDIITGALVCPECNRFYTIVEEIPTMLPDNLRKAEDDAAFLAKWSSSLPQNMRKSVET